MRVVLTPVMLAASLTVTWLPTQAVTTDTSRVAASETSSLHWHSADAHQTWTRGTVVRVSAARGKLTIEHEPIMNLEMMAMTMPFTVSDPAMLEGLTAGDAIEFVAGKNGEELVVKELRKVAS